MNGDLRLQAIAVATAIVVWTVGGVWFDLGSGTVGLAVLVGGYFLCFAGVHLYQAVRGRGGDVPVDARWRFVIVVTVVLGLGVVGALLGETIAGFDRSLVLGVLIGAISLAYLGYEISAGYAGSRAVRERI